MLSRKFKIGLVFALVIVVIGIFAIVNKKPASVPESLPIKVNGTKEVIGKSVQMREIESYEYGTGDKKLVLVGGMHGGYEWNSIVLAEKMMQYLKENPGILPANLSVVIIPNLNPDGVIKDAKGRFNANGVDLNRNFDCKWKPESMWQGKKVSGGTKAFSEPESQVFRDFILQNKLNIKGVVFWHSKANAVYASECKEGILPVTLDIMNVYAKASGYKPIKTFDSYEVTGDAEGWLASINIPAITVELKTHETIEWSQNLAGVKALLEYYDK